MGASDSSLSHTEGSVDGNPVTFFYKRADGDADAKLSWTAGHKVYPDAQWSHIAGKDIIVVINPKNATSSDLYYVLYVQDNPAINESQESVSPKILKSLELFKPPKGFVHDFHACQSNIGCLALRHDQAKVQPNFHIIVSTGSGTGLALFVWVGLLKPVLDRGELQEGKDYVVHRTTSESSVAEFTTSVLLPQANLGVVQSVLILSGDGGLLDIVNSLLAGERSGQYAKPNVGILPFGTGNALAHSSGVTNDNTLGLRAWIAGTPKKLPLFKATFSTGARYLLNEARDEQTLHLENGIPTAYGAVVCSWGLHAALVADSDTAEYRKFGNERFKMAAKESLFPSDGSLPHAYRGAVSILGHSPDGSEKWDAIQRDEHGYILATLVSTLEKGFTISPASKPLDGKLRLVHFGPMSGEDVMNAMGGAYQGGKHVEDERVGYEVIQGMRIEFHEVDARWRRVCIDGKIVRVEKGGWIEVRPDRSSVLDLISL